MVTRRAATWLVVGTAAVSVLGTLGVVVVQGEVRASVVPRTVEEVCDPGASSSAGEGWCVQHRRQDGGLLHEQQDWVYLVAVRDGVPSSRVTYAPWPFDDEHPLDVRFGADRIVLIGDEGVEVAYPEQFYALD